jgi:hypothetical protein
MPSRPTTLATGDERGLDYAERTFDLLQRYCVDAARGGFYENLEPDWQLSPSGFCAGDRKSLDIHMHLLECLTVLAQASGKEIHRRRLEEVIHVILTHMIDPAHGCGGNQYDLAFNPIPAIAIRRTFNAEREGELVAAPTDTTSYGHNIELAWLLVRAGEILGKPRHTPIWVLFAVWSITHWPTVSIVRTVVSTAMVPTPDPRWCATRSSGRTLRRSWATSTPTRSRATRAIWRPSSWSGASPGTL